jgi:imidazoleglycerol-phosphate dehydratase
MTCSKVGTFDVQLVEEFWRAFVNNAGLNLHIEVVRGKNMHHIIEAVFKAAGRALDQATRLESRTKGTLSTKGVL